MRRLVDLIGHVSALAESGVRGTALEGAIAADPERRLAWARAFTDDFGHRRAVDAPLLAWVLGLPPWQPPNGGRVDVRLWHALSEGTGVPAAWVGGAGPVCPQAREEGIEVWTEIELASLQALWWHSRRAEPPLRARAVSLARWLMAELQPDNATNRPWAIAAFAELAAAGDSDAALYADTLLHNCQVTLGRPDVLSALLLMDASRCLTESAQGD